MQVFLEPDAVHVLRIPYGSEATRQFWNLKKMPTLIEHIPELSDDITFREFVRAINRPESRFGSLGCEKWMNPEDHPNGLTHQAGLYIDIVLGAKELATHVTYERLTAELRRRGDTLAQEQPYSNFALIRVEPKQVMFHELDWSCWMVGVWVYGAGHDEASARGARNHGLQELGRALDGESSRIGQAGTRIFDSLRTHGAPPV